MTYTPTIGLEIHAELNTATKMFCSSKNDPNEQTPNVNICPICTAHPGTLPVVNKSAVHATLLVGAALSAQIADYTEFDRKNYFYPDIPKGYQISQYKFPLVSGGTLKDVAITRVHLEEDTARSTHTMSDGSSLVDFNRAGVPLMELVTDPVIKNAADAVAFAREFQLLLRYLRVSEANLEKGEMRIEVNISVSNTEMLGVKVEIKNLNSFKAVEQAIQYEIKRHISTLERGDKITQETRGWDENTQKTFSQRQKEGSADYRYFPDPDIPKLRISDIPEFSLQALMDALPELPEALRMRYRKTFGLHSDDVDMYVRNPLYRSFFESVAKEFTDTAHMKLVSNYITSDLVGLCGTDSENIPITPVQFSTIINMILENKISSRGAKDIIAYIVEKGGNPEEIAESEGLYQVSDTEGIEKIVLAVIESNPGIVSDYKNGKEAALQYLIGQGMKLSKGSANPSMLTDLLKKNIE